MRARNAPKKRTKPAARTKIPPPRPSNPGRHRGEDIGRFDQSELQRPRRGEAS